MWACTIAAEVALLVQVGIGTALVAGDRYAASNMHMFYGFASFLAIGLAFQYRDSFRAVDGSPHWQRLELFYGLFGLFLMGMSLRAVFEVTT